VITGATVAGAEIGDRLGWRLQLRNHHEIIPKCIVCGTQMSGFSPISVSLPVLIMTFSRTDAFNRRLSVYFELLKLQRWSCSSRPCTIELYIYNNELSTCWTFRFNDTAAFPRFLLVRSATARGLSMSPNSPPGGRCFCDRLVEESDRVSLLRDFANKYVNVNSV